MCAHKELYRRAGILHRDVSENNIVLTDPDTNNGCTGLLIDLDRAIETTKMSSGLLTLTGTREFMAYGLLNAKPSKPAVHTYQHDIESFFYVLLWVCGIRSWTNKKLNIRVPSPDPLDSEFSRWNRGDLRDCALIKCSHMTFPDVFDELLIEFPPNLECVKPFLRRIREHLFPGVNFDYNTKDLDPEIFYTPITNILGYAIKAIQHSSETESA